MKVGFSLGKCVGDIYRGKVKYDEILVIISNTAFDPKNEDHWSGLWDGYSRIETYWADFKGCESEIRDICLKLHRDGKLHQPRKFGSNPNVNYPKWVNVFLTDEDHENNPSLKLAYEKYRTLAGLL